MNTLVANIFTDSTAEYVNLQSSFPSIDFTDSSCLPSTCASVNTSPNFLVTAPVGEIGYYEIQYMMANNFWGCQFAFGNSNCGIQIRQGIAHMLDKNQFCNFSGVAGTCTPIDNPVPTTSTGDLPSPDPCGYDASFPQLGPNCTVGAPGGTSYHLGAAAGANGYAWLQAPGSADLNSAAQHFVNAGLATGFNPATSILTGISGSAATNKPTFFIRNDDTPRIQLGESLASQMCYIFTGAYTTPCTYLNTVEGPITAFPGFPTATTSVDLNWWMYTAAYSHVPFFDDSLYYNYNSRFVSGLPSIQPPNGPCSTQALPTSGANNYMYLCSPNYDSLSSQMENAPSLSQAVALGLQAEAYFGANAFTLPVFEKTVQFAYLNNGWIRAINDAGVGLPNYFTWQNTYNPSPPVAGTIRQGLSRTPISVNPYIASTPPDLYIVNNVYDSLSRPNPLAPSQLLSWMPLLIQQFANDGLGYMAPPQTLNTYRFTWPNDIFFQDGRQVTMYDVAFSYLSLVGSGAFLGAGASSITGITIISNRQFDIGVNSLGPFVLPNLTSLPILPGRYWTNAGASSWDSAVAICTSTGCSSSQYTLTGSTVNCALSCSPFSEALMTVNPAYTTVTFDPIASHIFVGSGPWQCGTVTSSGSGMCSSSGAQSPPVGGSYTLTRFGCSTNTTCLAPATSATRINFHSSGDLALFIWESAGQSSVTINSLSSVVFCYGQPVNPVGSCAHWQQGIGASSTGVVSINQVSEVSLHFNNDWISPFMWVPHQMPLGIGDFPPVLYEGSATLNPASIVGCASPYPAGGYDC